LCVDDKKSLFVKKRNKALAFKPELLPPLVDGK
jgi:hypothetical protein